MPYDDRLTSAQRGYGHRWRKARDAYLAEHPCCIECEKRGRIVAATVVDHVVAPKLAEAIESGDAARLRTARKLFWSRSNWQSLCKLCHDSFKQAIERSGRVPGCTDDGLPVDPSHHWNTP